MTLFQQIAKEIEGLSKKELLKLIKAYDQYVIDFADDHDSDCCPACLMEFYTNEYQEADN